MNGPQEIQLQTVKESNLNFFTVFNWGAVHMRAIRTLC